MTRTQELATDGVLGDGERRHLLRRLAFAATPALEEAVRGLSAAARPDSDSPRRRIAIGCQAARVAKSL